MEAADVHTSFQIMCCGVFEVWLSIQALIRLPCQYVSTLSLGFCILYIVLVYETSIRALLSINIEDKVRYLLWTDIFEDSGNYILNELNLNNNC